MQNQWEITQEADSLPELNNPVFIEGLPGIGNVGKIVVDFMIEELNAKKLSSFPESPKIYCTSNDEKLLKAYLKKGAGIEKNIYGVVGPIVGVSGILLGLGKKRKVKGVALLAETFGHPMYLGVKGAKEILKILEKKFSYGININKM